MNIPFALLVLGIMAFLVLRSTIKDYWREYKAKQKTRASEPVEMTWAYDSKAHRKTIRRELHESMRGRRYG